MSKLLFGALILMTVALLACNGEEPTQEPTATLEPASPPPQTMSIPSPTATLIPPATPTHAPSPTATLAPTIAPQQQVPDVEMIAALPLNNLQALMTELSPVELYCMAGSDNSRRLSAVLQAPDMASQEDIAELGVCLRDGTLLRLYLTGVIGHGGTVSGETSECIRAGFAEIDFRSTILEQIAGENEGWGNATFRTTISCLNEEEWAVAAPVLGLSPNYREGVECLTRELGGPEETAAALQLSEQGPSFTLVAATLGCGLTESDLFDLAATPPPAVTPEDSAIAPLNLEDVAAFTSELSLREQSCVSENVETEQLPLILIDAESAPAQFDALVRCLEDETLLSLFISQLTGLTSPLSAETSTCTLQGMQGIDLRSVMLLDAEGDEQAVMVDQVSAYITALSCLNDAEWQATSAVSPLDSGQRAGAQCAMNQIGGPEALTAALQSEDGSGEIAILTAVLGCGLQVGAGAGG